MKTPQEAFNTVARHLLTQGQRAAIANQDLAEICRYRAPGGLKCAVGCLIPDDKYKEEFEGYSIGALPIRSVLESEGYYCGNLLGQLQRIHDTIEPHNWLPYLKDLATRLGLSSRILQEFS